MKEIKAFVRSTRLTLILEALKSAGFYNATFSLCEGTGGYQNENASPSLRFLITDSEIVKLEMVCATKDVDTIVQIITQNGRTNEPGDGIVYVSSIERGIKVKNGQDASSDFIKNKNTE
jgi:nitrogen regulatory protein P-II 1